MPDQLFTLSLRARRVVVIVKRAINLKPALKSPSKLDARLLISLR